MPPANRSVAPHQPYPRHRQARYGRYFVTVMLGTGYIMVKPIAGLFKNPVSGAIAVVGIAGTAYFVYFTVNAMLGITDPVGYEPSSIVTP